MELDVNLVLNMALDKIQELERELIYSKAICQQLTMELERIKQQKENNE